MFPLAKNKKNRTTATTIAAAAKDAADNLVSATATGAQSVVESAPGLISQVLASLKQGFEEGKRAASARLPVKKRGKIRKPAKAARAKMARKTGMAKAKAKAKKRTAKHK